VTMDGTRVGYSPGRFSFRISHPDYETVAMIQVRRDKFNRDQEVTVYAPMLVPGSELEKRGIWGVVVDEYGEAVEGAVIRIGNIIPHGGKSMRCTVAGQRPGVLTDSEGRFLFYPKVREGLEAMGTIVPEKSQYYVRAEVPENSDLLEFRGRIPNGEASIIQLKRSDKKHFHSFVFEDENGLIKDVRRLRDIDIAIDRNGKRIEYLRYQEWRDGGVFPLGVYTAKGRPSGKAYYNFLPVEVTEDSVEELVFKAVAGEKKYYGRAIDGVTSEPMEGVFILDVTGSGFEPGDIEKDSWDVLHALPGTDPNGRKAKHRARQLVEQYRLGRMVRTDSEGYFEMIRPAKTYVRKFLILEEEYLPVYVEKDLFVKGDDSNIGLPVTRMFPSAKIIMDPRADTEGGRSPRTRFFPRWIVDINCNESWTEDLVAGCIDDYKEGIYRDYDFNLNRGPQSCYVPAGVAFDLRFRPWSHRYRHDNIWSSMTVGRDLKLEQGEVLDLGRVEIERGFTLFAEVQDSMGAAVEGLPVKACDQYGEVVSNTDDNGVAMFTVARDSKGEFVVEFKPEEGQAGLHLREAVPYEIRGVEDANSVYEFSVSERIVYELLK